jgi:hypothetical protein
MTLLWIWFPRPFSNKAFLLGPSTSGLYLTSSILRIYTDPSLEEVLGHQKAALLTSRSLSRMTICPSSDS